MSEKEQQDIGIIQTNELEVETLSREGSKKLSEYAKKQKEFLGKNINSNMNLNLTYLFVM